MEHTKTILLLDGDEQSAHDIQRFLKVSAYTFSLSHASDIAEGLNFLRTRQPDLVLVDAELIQKREFASIKTVLDKNKVPLILLSEAGGVEMKQQALNAGAQDYLVKNKINLFSLQKIIVNTLKINETESRLDSVHEEYSTRQETFMQMLNSMSEGAIVINRDNVIRYANTRAYTILGEDSFRKSAATYMNYREMEGQETIQVKTASGQTITIRVNSFNWNGEEANLFIVEKMAAPVTAPEQTSKYLITNLLNTVDTNLLLLKNDKIEFANKFAAQTWMMKPEEIKTRRLNDIFGSEDELLNSASVQMFMADKESEGIIRVADGSTRKVTYAMRHLTLEDELYQLLSFDVIPVPVEKEMPGARSDEEAFSSEGVLHLASHDLREPVRTILNYVQLISDNLQKGKYDDASEYAGFARNAASRMEKLLTDLKAYIALSSHNFSLAKVSVKLAVNDVLKSMKPVIEERKAVINVAEMPDISADRELVEKIFGHLIDNALKFHKKEKPAIIDVGFDRYEGNIIFCVRDNGIGISKKYQEKIFELFERLNRVDEYPGNGLGLAICKKAIEMHGGKIWVESLPGFGSSFYFTLRSK